MGNYLKHLSQMSSGKTFSRKVDYLRFNIENILSGIKNPTILEIGPGVGEFEYFLNSKNIKDIDIADNDRDVLSYVFNKYKVKNSILIKNPKDVSKKLRNYDIIFLMQVLEHIPVPSFNQFLKTLYSHLNKNGFLIIIVPNANNPLGLTERYADIQHTISFTTQSLRDLSNLVPFRNSEITIKGFEIPPYGIVNLIRKILQKLLHAFLILLMAINGGVFYKTMTPNIMMIVKKTK